ncbi:MAG: phosphatidylinositol-specific phospholipase C1-like protein [Actinomycetota bacterium]|nr:phosphatidylinositol-specific phospholipase C1-like protein [Actinomycetota bacterium]
MPVRDRRFITPLAAIIGAIVMLGAIAIGLSAGPATASNQRHHHRWHRPHDVDRKVRLNQIQVIGSHNSYHQILDPPELALRRQLYQPPVLEQALEYTHAPLPVQFESQKIRQIELDVWLDPAGGKYANPLIRAATNGGPYDPVMTTPGIKVFHVQDVDYHSSCLTLKICLTQVKQWSDAHPSHVPIAILTELKDDPLKLDGFTFVAPDPWTTTPGAMDSLDREIRSVFPSRDLITPDDIRGHRPTLENAVLTKGWPTLRESRGKLMFLMDNAGDKRLTYLQGHPSLDDRVLFTNANPGDADAAFVERNDAKGSGADIRSLVQKGYVVRTRADADTAEARTNDTSTRDAALASGAQWVSTDYPVPNYAFDFTTTYFAQIPGGTVARCNPINAPRRCDSALLEAGRHAR